jgi:hypothetical protein
MSKLFTNPNNNNNNNKSKNKSNNVSNIDDIILTLDDADIDDNPRTEPRRVTPSKSPNSKFHSPKLLPKRKDNNV